MNTMEKKNDEINKAIMLKGPEAAGVMFQVNNFPEPWRSVCIGAIQSFCADKLQQLEEKSSGNHTNPGNS